jgi:hypothetical protein
MKLRQVYNYFTGLQIFLDFLNSICYIAFAYITLGICRGSSAILLYFSRTVGYP